MNQSHEDGLTAKGPSGGEAPKRWPLEVLLVEDSEDDAQLIADALRKGGFEPRWRRVESAEAMRRALDERRCELILADHRLPSFSAMQAFAIYREKEFDFPFIIVSGKIGEEAAVAAMKAGVHDYLDKSRLARLAPAIRRELAEAATRSDKRKMQSQLHAAYAELQEQRDALALQAHLIDLSHDAIITATPDGLIKGWNAGAAQMYGWTEADAVGKLNRSVLATDSLLALDANTTLHRDGWWDGELLYVRRDGQTIVMDSRQVLLRDENGVPAGTLEVNRDITQRKLAEDQLKRSLNEQVVLLKEVHHRVKNNLQIIRSLLSMQAASVEDPETAAKLRIGEGRVTSMAMIHEQLYNHENMSSLDLAEYGRDLVAKLFAINVPSPSITYRIDATPITLTIEQAVPCGLILNELVTNALKYAYPKGKGEILISLSSRGDNVHMKVSDKGVGLPAGFDLQASESLGMKLVQILSEQLDGKLEMGGPPGASFTVTFTKLPRT